jgi:hypothetical protein
LLVEIGSASAKLPPPPPSALHSCYVTQFQRHQKPWSSLISLLHVGVLGVFYKVPFDGSALDSLPTSSMLVFPSEDFNASVPSHTVRVHVNTYLLSYLLSSAYSFLAIRDIVTADMLNCIAYICYSICTNMGGVDCPNLILF